MTSLGLPSHPHDHRRRPDPASIIFDSMARNSALSNDSSEVALANIERQFTLTEESLLEITKAFLEEVATGLKEYNHPMAMMYSLLSTVMALSYLSLIARVS